MKKFKKIMLIKPPNIIPKEDIKRLVTPLGLLYLGAVLRNARYDVKILDSPCEGYNNISINGTYMTYGLSDEEVIKKIKEYNPDIVGISSMFSYQQKKTIHYCDLVKSVDKKIPVILGGVHPSLDPKGSIMNKSVDYVIIGEGENRFLNLLNLLNKGKKHFNFDGVAYKKDGNIIINPMITHIDDLDSLPLPARDLIDIEKYIEVGIPFAPFPRKERVEQIITTRGCPFNCIFCSSVHFMKHNFGMRSVGNILKEVKELKDKYGIQEIQFSDDNLTLNKKRAKELFKRLKSYNLSYCIPNGIMVQSLDKEMIKLMAEAGVYQLTFAIESGSQRVLKEIIGKKVPPKEEVKKLVDECHRYDIQVHGFFIFGLPGETKEELYKTLQYPIDNNFDSVSFYIASPEIGSRLYKECKEKGYLEEQTIGKYIKRLEINIPLSSSDYVMSKEKLQKLIDTKAKEFDEYTKRKNPKAWEIKHKQFLKKYDIIPSPTPSLHVH